MAGFTKHAVSVVVVKQKTTQFSGHVIGGDNNDAVGRTVVLLAKDEFSRYEVRTETKTDSAGNYAISSTIGKNDTAILIAVGDNSLAEYTRSLGNMVGE